MVDSTLFRLAPQVALVTWAVAQIAMLLFARNRLSAVAGARWAVAGLGCFALWMLLSSMSIYAVAILPRGEMIAVFAALELGTAIGAWGWLICNVQARFRVTAGGRQD